MKNTEELLEKLKNKYESMGQDISGYLDGLLHSDFLTYWDYIHLDTLLSLQTPRTAFPDEKIFILYHQITELYFRMIINELEQLVLEKSTLEAVFLKRIQRICSYSSHLVHSFDIMLGGMDNEQFLAFRSALLPSSGFQSVQYRLIEVYCTDFYLLTPPKYRKILNRQSDIEEVYEYLYWKLGASDLATGKKTLTLRQFEKKYRQKILFLANYVKDKNIRCHYHRDFMKDESIRNELKKMDHLFNISWKSKHLLVANKYLKQPTSTLEATGSTDWKKYLSFHEQNIIFYPELWSEAELQSIGKEFEDNFKNIRGVR